MIYMGKEQDDGSRNVIIVGTVTRDAKFEYTKNSHVPKVTFSVAHGNKQYMNCLVLGDRDSTLIASGLEQRDVVLCAGKWTRRTYTSKDGAPKNWDELLCEIVIPQPVPSAAMMESAPSSPSAPVYTNAAQAPFVEMDEDEEDLPF